MGVEKTQCNRSLVTSLIRALCGILLRFCKLCRVARDVTSEAYVFHGGSDVDLVCSGKNVLCTSPFRGLQSLGFFL